jgi:uncharacterized membrane protein YbaN (DUF454 family)
MKELKRVIVFCAGILSLILGLAGLALPFLQGWLFLGLGLALLALSSRKIRTWLEGHTQKYPFVHRIVQRTLEWLEKNIGQSS